MIALRALDLYCGGGGVAYGLLRAGFKVVVGVDIEDHSASYPGVFLMGDALKVPLSQTNANLYNLA